MYLCVYKMALIKQKPQGSSSDTQFNSTTNREAITAVWIIVTEFDSFQALVISNIEHILEAHVCWSVSVWSYIFLSEEWPSEKMAHFTLVAWFWPTRMLSSVCPDLVFFYFLFYFVHVLLKRKGSIADYLTGHLSNVAFALVNSVVCVHTLRTLHNVNSMSERLPITRKIELSYFIHTI